MVDDLSKQFATFEEMKHVDSNGIEYWFARELMVVKIP
jgi:LAS superfamily LD-carboxypeptidase LdcB